MSSKASVRVAEPDTALRRYHRLGPRLVFATLIALSLGLVATSVHTVLSERASLSEQLDARGESLVKVASPACVEWLLADDIPYLQTFVEGVARARTDVVFARIERVDGQLVCESTNDPQWRKHGAQSVKQYQADIVVPGGDDEKHKVLARVILGISTQSLDELQASRSRDLMFQAAASFVALAFALSFFLRRAVIHPISDLDRQRHFFSANLGQGVRLGLANHRHRFPGPCWAVRQFVHDHGALIEVQCQLVAHVYGRKRADATLLSPRYAEQPRQQSRCRHPIFRRNQKMVELNAHDQPT